ncbi:MAG: YHS domain-containing protein [Nitrospiraceae bacterium]
MGILRLVLVAGVLVVGYFLLRSAIKEFRGIKRPAQPPVGQNEMVQDPVCKTYVPRGSAVTADIGGQTYLFCSHDCAETYQKQLGRSS